ncbi:hypothetical protein FGG66_gp50 [Corynebacterium phage phi674]|uniref:Uncharacterized protein n=1 Tax=Corynebacterium phage phi674 TaxID=2052822 RepID=A0A2H4PJ19_9CAUD|nr:hypothetical protein FGG66_gp50 [Corynebacterium phage phi674]ATW62968.1 hypothetical protein phi674_gp50 [Corynebacterium phage phi674]
MGLKSDNRERLTDAQVEELRHEYVRLRDMQEPEEPVTEIEEYLAQRYGVTPVTVGNIASGKSRRNVGGPLTPRPKTRRDARKAGFVAGVKMIVRDKAGREVYTCTYPDGYTVSTMPVAMELSDDE